ALVKQLSPASQREIPKTALARTPLSFAQERLLFIERFEKGTSAYHIPCLLRLSPEASDRALWEEVLESLLERHRVLRSVFVSDDAGDYHQVVDRALTLSTLICSDPAEMRAHIAYQLAQPFDLFTDIPVRVQHYQVGQDSYLLLLLHHIAFDGWSTQLLTDELSALYRSVKTGVVPELPVLSIDYGDYAAWQRETLQGEHLERQLAYWQSQLGGHESLALPTDKPRPETVDYQGKALRFSLDVRLSEALRTFSRQQETTLYSVLLSGFYLTLANLTGQDDLVLGTPSDNRDHPQTQNLIGFFVNALALRSQIDLQSRVEDYIQQVHRLVLSAKAHQDVPFEKLVDALGVERDLSRHPIFQVMFSTQSFDASCDSAEPAPFAFEPLSD
ncbi:condensation domain-containing protein, partial [Microbulbifer aggregans]|uniref:condensation domain-containing protein n=1 Tax=Microbulbifer aggregans TaxID=1769779 RepID=UPI001CFCAAEA